MLHLRQRLQRRYRSKREGIERSDLEAVGHAFGLRQDGTPVIERVIAALADWEAVGEDAGVPERGIVWIRAAMRERGLVSG